MPVKCPKCTRINADNNKDCMYCKTSLDGAESFVPSDGVLKMAQHFLKQETPTKEAPKPELPKPSLVERKPTPLDQRPPSPEQHKLSVAKPKPELKIITGGKAPSVLKLPTEGAPRYWVVMPPVDNPSTGIVSALAELLRLDGFIVKQKLATRAPWVIARFPDADKARDLAKDLQKKGLDVYSITDAELREAPPKMETTKVTITDSGLIFEREKEKIAVRWDDVKLVVKGRAKLELSQESKSKSPIAKHRQRRGIVSVASDSWEWEMVDLYTGSGHAIRISERNTNFTGLGENRSPSALKNLRWIVDSFIESSLPVVDDSYKRVPPIMKPAAARSDAVARRLGKSLETQMASKYFDNTEHFDEYSVILWIQLQKLGS